MLMQPYIKNGENKAGEKINVTVPTETWKYSYAFMQRIWDF